MSLFKHSTGLFFFLSIAISFGAFAQPGCPDIDAGPDQVVDCSVNCVDLTATILETGATTSYTASSVPYAPPAPFSGGTAQFINTDDIWGDVINLPFNFCFYGNVYNQVVAGANGLLTFDVSQANQYCAWSYSASCPTPGPPPNGLYNNSVMGAYHDIDPSVGGDISYFIQGTAPCRMFILSYNNVPHYDCDCSFFSSCRHTTQQIVLYETTNVIEVYIQQKETCSSWNSGNAVIGIQDATGANGIAAPGRNTGPWSANNEGWRFTPDGAPNYVVTWYDNGTAIGTGLTLNVCPSSTTTYDGEVVYTNCDGAVVTVTDQVTVTQNSTVSVSVDPAVSDICAGQSVALTASSPNPGVSYTWSPAAGLSSTTGASVTASPANTTLYTVTADDGSCAASANANVNVVNVQLSTTSSDVTCVGNDGSASVTPSGGVTPYTYSWNTVPAQTTQSISGIDAGTYTVSVTDNTGCTANASITINASSGSLSPPQIAATDANCSAADGTATATPIDGVPPYTYSWNTSPVQTTQSATGLYAGNYVVTMTDSAGCTATANATVGADQGNLIANITASTDVLCNGSCDGTASVSAQNGTVPYQFLWDDSGAQTTQIAAGLCAGNVGVIVTDSIGCSATAQINIGEPTAVVANASMDQPSTCGMPNGQVSVSANGGTVASDYVYVWNTNPPQTTAIASGLMPGTYSVAVVDDNNCSATANVDVAAAPLFTANITSVVDANCFGTCNGQATASVNSSAQPPITYLWDSSPTQNTAIATDLCAGAYSVTITDGNGCDTTLSVTINQPPSLNLSAGSIDIICNGDDNGQAYVSPSGGNGPPYQLSWNDPLSQTTDTISYLPPGAYTVTVTDAVNCSIDTTISIIQPLPLILDLVIGADTCAYGNGLVQALMQGGTPPYTYVWSTIADSAHYVTDDIDHWNMISELRSGDYSVTVTDSNGCVTTGDANVPLIPGPDAQFSSLSKPEEFIDPGVQFSNESTGAVSYEWHFGDGDISYDVNPEHLYDTSGVFLVMLIAYSEPEYGCLDTSLLYMEVDPMFTFYVPNSFTPDDDGLNDTWGPSGQNFEYESYHLSVYDRWGMLIWQTDNPLTRWDGRYWKNDDEIKQGLYVYCFTLKKFNTFEPKIIKGTVTLYRHN